MTFEEGVALLFHKLGDSKIMALGSSVNDYVMVRNVAVCFMMEKSISRPIRISARHSSCIETRRWHSAQVAFR